MQCAAVAESAVGDRDGADPGLDARSPRTAQKDVPVAADRVWAVRVAVRVTPWPVLTGHGKFLLESRVERFQVVRSRWASRRRHRRRCGYGNPTGGSAGCSRRSAPSIRRRRGRSCSTRAAPGVRHRSGGVRSSTACGRHARRVTQSASGSQNGPASRHTTRHPARASRWVSTLPPAPAPTTTRSTSSPSA